MFNNLNWESSWTTKLHFRFPRKTTVQPPKPGVNFNCINKKCITLILLYKDWNNIFFFIEICTSRTVKKNPPTHISKTKESSVELFWLTWNNFQQIRRIKTEFTITDITASILGFTALCDWFTFSTTLTSRASTSDWLILLFYGFLLTTIIALVRFFQRLRKNCFSLVILNHWLCNRRHRRKRLHQKLLLIKCCQDTQTATR